MRGYCTNSQARGYRPLIFVSIQQVPSILEGDLKFIIISKEVKKAPVPPFLLSFSLDDSENRKEEKNDLEMPL